MINIIDINLDLNHAIAVFHRIQYMKVMTCLSKQISLVIIINQTSCWSIFVNIVNKVISQD